MNLNGEMDTQNLEAFVAVANRASFSLAAEYLHLTQPAVSKRIATLESQLACRLFDRIGRSVHLTEAGRVLLPKARAILQQVQDTQRLMTDLSGNVRGPLPIATSHHIGLHRLPAALQSYHQRYPAVKLDIDFIGSENAYDAVSHGRVELAVVTLAPDNPDNISYLPLWPDPLEFVVADQHPLANLAVPTLADLSQHTALLPDLDTITSRLVKAPFIKQQLPLQTAMATNYMETLKMLAGIGLGWTVLPQLMIEPPLKVLSIKDVQLTRELGIIYHRNRSLSNAARHFIEHLTHIAQCAA